MEQYQRERLGAATGIVAVVLIVASFILGPGEPPGFDDTAEEVADFVAANRAELQTTTALTVVAGVFFVWFLGSLSQALRRAEGRGPGRLAPVAFAGGILAFAFAGLGTGLQWTAAYHGELDPTVVEALWDSGLIAFLLSAGSGFAILIAASSIVALTTGALPSALGWYGVLLAAFTIVVAVIGTFAETGAFSPSDGALPLIAFLGFLVWVLITSVVLVRRTGEGASPEG